MPVSFEQALILVMVLVLVYILVFRGRRDAPGDNNQQEQIEQLSRSITDLKQGLSESISTRLEKNNDSFIHSLQRQSRDNNELIAGITKNLTEIKESNKRVISVSDELKTIQNILTNPKQRGVLGEYYLESLLQNVMPPDLYQS